MTQNTLTTIINIDHEVQSGVWYASSEDVFGLNVTASGMDQLKERLVTAIKWLYEKNENTSVEVHFPNDPIDFTKHQPKHNFNQVVLSAKAA